MSSWFRKACSFLRLGLRQQVRLAEAAFWLALAWSALRLLPFRWIARYLGDYRRESDVRERPEDLGRLSQVLLAIRVVSGNLPIQCTCLVQAMAGQWMLRRRGVSGTVYLGVARDRETGELTAHAWLRSGERIITGKQALSRGFTVVATFADTEQ